MSKIVVHVANAELGKFRIDVFGIIPLMVGKEIEVICCTEPKLVALVIGIDLSKDEQ
jgi:hypothetical protein